MDKSTGILSVKRLLPLNSDWFTLTRLADRPETNDLFCEDLRIRRGVRAAEGARLESVYTVTYRGFESLPLRHFQRF